MLGIKIQPVTRKRLFLCPYASYATAEEMRENFIIGDIVLLRARSSETRYGMYIPKYDDFCNYYSLFEEGIFAKGYYDGMNNGGGFVIHQGCGTFGYSNLSAFDKNLYFSQSIGNGDTVCIDEVYRNVWRKQYTTKDFFVNLQIDTEDIVNLMWRRSV